MAKRVAGGTWNRAMSPRREQKRRRGRREVNALQGVGLEIVGHPRGIGADHRDHGRRHPGQRQGVRVDAQPRCAEPCRGPVGVEAREQVGRDGKRQRHRAQPVAQRHGRDPESREHVIPGPPFGQRHVQQSDGQGEKAHRRQMRTFAVDDQRVEAASGKPAAGVEAHFLHQQAGRRDQRVADTGDEGGGAIAAQPPRHPEERHRTERIDGGRHEVVRQAGRYAGARDYQSADHVKERRIGIGVRNAAVPEWEPRELAEVVCDVAGEADVRRLDGPHLPRVVGVKQAQRDKGVECEERQSARRCPEPLRKISRGVPDAVEAARGAAQQMLARFEGLWADGLGEGGQALPSRYRLEDSSASRCHTSRGRDRTPRATARTCG